MASNLQLPSCLSFLCAGIMIMHHHAQLLLIVIHCDNHALITSQSAGVSGSSHSLKRQKDSLLICSVPWGMSFNLPCLSCLSCEMGIITAHKIRMHEMDAQQALLARSLARLLTSNGAHTTLCQRMRHIQEPTNPMSSWLLRSHPKGQRRKTHFSGCGSVESWLL